MTTTFSRGLTALRRAAAVLSVLALPWAAQAQVLAMPDSTNNRMVLFSPFDGSLLNSDYFALAGGTPLHAIEVGNEIWVSEQVGDRVSRWSLTGTFLGEIGGAVPGGGLDNVRGMARVGSTVYVSNSGTANGAPGAALVMYGTDGTPMGSFATPNAPSPFAVLPFGGGLLVASSSANDDVHRYSLTGTALGTFHNSATLNFAQQMAVAANGDILVAGFSSNNVVRLDAASGAVLGTFAAAGARGVAQLANGNVLWTSAAGASIYDVALGTSTLVYTGGGRHLGLISAIPEPGTWALWLAGLAGLTAWQRRRTARR
jgi:MYXO-CTERM domain-containing protein